MNELPWSATEKKVAREAFDRAIERERAAIRSEAAAMLAEAGDDEVIWRLHNFLSKKRRQFDQKYDFRYSQLIWVFANLMADGWVTEEDLAGLRPDKIEKIKGLVAIHRE